MDPNALTPPLPVPTPTTAPFWSGLAEGVVRIQRCEACGHWIFYPRAHCPRCLAPDPAWHAVSGAATLYSWTVCHRAPAPHFEGLTPFVLAVVELAEGPRMTTRLVAADDARLAAGMALEPVIDDAGPVPMLLFRPADAAPTQA